MIEKYPMTPQTEKFLRHVLTLKDLEQPVAVDDAYDVLMPMGNQELRRICGCTDDDLKDKIENDLNTMEQNDAGPWVKIVLGEKVEGWDDAPPKPPPKDLDATCLEGDRPDLADKQAARDFAAEVDDEGGDEEDELDLEDAG